MRFDNTFSRQILGILLIVFLFVTGCSNKATVTGTVTYSDNGEPVRSGIVVFTGEKEMGRGVIRDGRYSIGLSADGEGIHPGRYTVLANSLPSEMDMVETVDILGNRTRVLPEQMEYYKTKEPQTIEVKGSMTYDFTVERITSSFLK
jgi:hypothetical protein